VAVVADGGDALGRQIALALAAGGARVVVAGRDERALGETVGEIAHGGGRARHVVGDARAAVARARETFGAATLVVLTAEQGAEEIAAIAADLGLHAS
jgi:3-oxoacyl-[acyl-carrier protein] reductase